MSLNVCSLFSGSSGNCTYIGTEKTHILVDAGVPMKNVVSSLKQIGVDIRGLKGLMVTHEHTDHIKGIGALSRRLDIPVYANEGTWEAMMPKLGNIAPHNVRVFQNNMDFYIQDINIQPYEIPHDAADPVGFCFYAQNKKISITTDLGHTNSRIIKAVMDSDLVILEANHDSEMLMAGRYPMYLKKRIAGRKGHLSNEDTGKALLEIIKGKAAHILLAHLSKENNYPQLAWQTVTDILESSGVKVGKDIQIDMTYRDKASNFYQIG
ncbi:MAG: MBL fold metallo-hydrolase [Caldicoprobacterales bacterium]